MDLLIHEGYLASRTESFRSENRHIASPSEGIHPEPSVVQLVEVASSPGYSRVDLAGQVVVDVESFFQDFFVLENLKCESRISSIQERW